MRTLFGSLTDPAFVSERHDAAAAGLVGTVTYVWAGAVLHVRRLLIHMRPAAIQLLGACTTLCLRHRAQVLQQPIASTGLAAG